MPRSPNIMLSNTYFLNLRPGAKALRAFGGLHNLMGWDRGILTDSGGFQMVSLLSLSEVKEDGVHFISPVDGTRLLLTPEESVRTQQAIGSDIVMQLDDVVSAMLDPSDPIDRERISTSTARTTRWLDRCIATHQDVPEWRVRAMERGLCKPQCLFAICQGHLDLTPGGFRDRCIRDLSDRRDMLDGIAIGGLSGGEAKDSFWRVVAHCCERLPQDVPRYLMGVGFPLDLIVCACLGVDMFDCVYATRTARFGNALVPSGIIRLSQSRFRLDTRPIQEGCACSGCKVPRAYLHSLLHEGSPVAGQLISAHNVAYLLQLMGGLRDAILAGETDEYVQGFLQQQFSSAEQVPKWAQEALAHAGIRVRVWGAGEAAEKG